MRPLTSTETKTKMQNLLSEKGKKSKKELIRETQLRVMELEDDGIEFYGNFTNNTLYPKLNEMSTRPITAEEIAVFADVLNVDTDYLLTDTDKKRKDVSDVAEYLGLSEDAVNCILDMKEKHNIDSVNPDELDSRLDGLDALLTDKDSNRLFDILGEQKQMGDIHTALKGVYKFPDGKSGDELTFRSVLDYRIHHIIVRIVDRLRGEE